MLFRSKHWCVKEQLCTWNMLFPKNCEQMSQFATAVVQRDEDRSIPAIFKMHRDVSIWITTGFQEQPMIGLEPCRPARGRLLSLSSTAPQILKLKSDWRRGKNLLWISRNPRRHLRHHQMQTHLDHRHHLHHHRLHCE